MPHVLPILSHLIQLTQHYWEKIKCGVVAVLPLQAYVRGKGTPALIDKLSTDRIVYTLPALCLWKYFLVPMD